MAYSRRVVKDYETVMNKDLYDNLQDGIDESKHSLGEQNQRLNEHRQKLEEIEPKIPPIYVGGILPVSDTFIWFDTIQQQEDLTLLTLSDNKSDGDVNVSVAGNDYTIKNSTINEDEVTDKSLLFSVR